VTYFHLAYDLSKLYDVILQTIADVAGPEAAQQAQMANMMVSAYAQADIPTVLKALGTRHSVILLEGKETTRKVQEYDFETEQMQEVQRTTYVRPGALVWDLAAPEVWNRVMTSMKNFAPAMGGGADGGVAAIDEQGFTGLQLEQGAFPASLMVGQDKMMFGFGPDISARTLSLLNQPPAAGNAMATSALFEEGSQLIDYRDNVLFVIQDGGQDMVNSKQQIMTLLDGGQTDLEPSLIQQIKNLIPSDEELRSSFGVSVGQIYLTDAGLVYEGAAATPPAE
jgi:hypothetical protein